MQNLARTALAISKTSSRLRKVAMLAEYFRALSDDDLRAAAVFFTGRPFPLTDARTLNVGGAAILRSIQEITATSDQQIHDSYLTTGDLGETVANVLAVTENGTDVSAAQVRTVFDELAAAQSAAARQQLLTDLLQKLTPLE